jgi:hypothetical protein
MQIQKLGLEIRKLGSLNNLYKDVDMILRNYDIKSGEINTTIQSNAVAHALQKMLSVEKGQINELTTKTDKQSKEKWAYDSAKFVECLKY